VERKNVVIKIADYFIYRNPYNGDTEYFKLKKTGAEYFPIDKSDNEFWTYVGTYPEKAEPLSGETPARL